MKGSQAFLKILREHGNDTIYGVVGRETAEILFDKEDGISFLTTRHETTAGIMADVAARLTGKPQICFCTLGPGSTNIATAVAGALLDRSPLIAIAAQMESTDLNYGNAHQCIDQTAMMSAITKKSFEVYSLEEMIEAIEEAYSITVEEPQGPVFISIPIDIFKQEVNETKIASHKNNKDRKRINNKTIIKGYDTIFNSCQLPIFIVGGQAIRCNVQDTLTRIAETYEISVYSSYNAKGCIDIQSKAWKGTLTTSIDRILSNNILESSLSDVDVIILVGYDYAEDLPPALWEFGKEKKILRICSNINTNKTVHTDLDMVGDMENNLLLLEKYLQNHYFKYSYIKDYNKSITIENPLVYDEKHINVASIIRKINSISGLKHVITDVGYFRHIANAIYETSIPNEYICTAGLSAFGFGVGAALGAKYINSKSDVILLCGDGGFHSHSQELESYIRMGLPVTIIIFNNSSFGLIKEIQYRYNKRFSKKILDFGMVDFCKLAEANGCDFLKIHAQKEFDEYFKNRTIPKKTIVIEIMC